MVVLRHGWKEGVRVEGGCLKSQARGAIYVGEELFCTFCTSIGFLDKKRRLFVHSGWNAGKIH